MWVGWCMQDVRAREGDLVICQLVRMSKELKQEA